MNGKGKYIFTQIRIIYSHNAFNVDSFGYNHNHHFILRIWKSVDLRFIAILLVFVQYMIGPKMVETMMHVHYVSEQEAPNLHAMIEDLCNESWGAKAKNRNC